MFSISRVRFTSGNPNAALPAPATTFGGLDAAQAAAQAAVAALGVVSVARPTTTLRLNNMLTTGDLEDEAGLGDIEEETKVRVLHAFVESLVLLEGWYHGTWVGGRRACRPAHARVEVSRVAGRR